MKMQHKTMNNDACREAMNMIEMAYKRKYLNENQQKENEIIQDLVNSWRNGDFSINGVERLMYAIKSEGMYKSVGGSNSGNGKEIGPPTKEPWVTMYESFKDITKNFETIRNDKNCGKDVQKIIDTYYVPLVKAFRAEKKDKVISLSSTMLNAIKQYTDAFDNSPNE